MTLNDPLTMNAGELATDYRARQAVERAEADERRRLGLLELSSAANAPEARIRAWERAYRLTLPRDASHPVLPSVAAATHLSLQQVRDEQLRRSTTASPVVPAA